jgi:hypothetical protein
MKVILRVLCSVCAILALACVSDAKEWRGMIYANEEEGMSFYVDVSGVVADFYYGPTAKDKRLRCPGYRA